MMPSTLIRWPLLFISGIFIPLREMAPWARALAYLSPLTYAQDAINYAVFGSGYLNRWLDLALLLFLSALFLLGETRQIQEHVFSTVQRLAQSKALNNSQIIRAALVVPVGFLASGILGFVRTEVLAAQFGAGVALDSFLAAQQSGG